MQINFTRKKKVITRVVNAAIEKETEQSIFISGNFLVRFRSGRGPLRECFCPDKVYDLELPIVYKDRLKKVLDSNSQEPVEFEL